MSNRTQERASGLGTSTNPIVVSISEKRPATSAVTSVASNVAAVPLLGTNVNRRGAFIFNDGSNNLFVKLGNAASLTSFTVKILAGGFYEVPEPIYTGDITGIWDVATGSARITELTP